jgi:DNA repair protein RecN (Recombination protein N)
MLSYLRVRGLALIDDLTLELSAGLNVLTGETGAGKSLLVDALMLLRGVRARTELIRAGEDAASVEAQFELAPRIAQELTALLQLQELPPPSEGELLVRRTVPRSGRGRIFLQDTLVPQAVLVSTAELLVDICSQHEHHSLTQVSQHIALLDTYAGLGDELQAYTQLWRQLKDAQTVLAALQQQGQGAEQRLEYLRFQLQELEASFVQQLQNELHESDTSIIGRLGWFCERARTEQAQSPHLAAIAEALQAARESCDEALQSAQRFADGIDLDPAHLEQAEERLHQLLSLKRKHGVALEELAARLLGLRQKLSELENLGDRVLQQTAKVERLRDEALVLARRLHLARTEATQRLSRALVSELTALHLPKARLTAEVSLQPDDKLGPLGLDDVEFRFSANHGEPLAALTRVASGGELSRVLLALKGVLAEEDRVATYVFDEVDAGVGGAVAALHHSPSPDRRLRRQSLPRREADSEREDSDACAHPGPR